MRLVNCKNCGLLTLDRLEGYCPDCWHEREMLISIVKDFLVFNSQAGLSEIVEHTGVSTLSVIQFIQERRISIHGEAAKPRLAYGDR